jgi:putative methionine-R-sulfoxide reductase with GAF domain
VPAERRIAALLPALERALHDEPTAEARMRAVGLILAEAFDADRCILGRVEDGGVLAVGGHGLAAAASPAFARQLVAAGIVIRTARLGRGQRVDDVLRDPDYVAAAAMTRSELTAPIVVLGRVAAVVDLEANRIGAFTAEDEVVLEAAAGALAGALERLGL